MKNFKSMKSFLSIISVLVFAFALGFTNIQAADFATQLAEQFLKKIPVTEVDANMTMEQAVKVQEEFVSILTKEFGKPVGYKAGLTNPNVQKVFGVSQPVRGTLLKKMMLKSGTTIPANFGSISMSEGDLIVRVKDDAINQAKTPEETLKHLDAVIPFIELPDLVCDKSVKFNGAILVAINVGARYGVMGKPIPLKTTPEWIERLKNFTLQVFDEKGALVAEGKGTALLGDPLNVVLWIKDSLAAEGKKLKKGDLLSLGSLTKMMPSKPGATVKAVYTGLDPKGPVEISVTFE
jgi:2-keto-4-pentenoate hydratase